MQLFMRWNDIVRGCLAGIVYNKSQEHKHAASFYLMYPDATLGYAIGNLNAALADFYLELANAIMYEVE